MVYFHLSQAKTYKDEDTRSFFLFNECTVGQSWIHMCEKLEKYEEIDLHNFLGSQMTLRGGEKKSHFYLWKCSQQSSLQHVHSFTCSLKFFAQILCDIQLGINFYQLAIILGSKNFYLLLEMNEAIVKTLQNLQKLQFKLPSLILSRLKRKILNTDLHYLSKMKS